MLFLELNNTFSKSLLNITSSHSNFIASSITSVVFILLIFSLFIFIVDLFISCNFSKSSMDIKPISLKKYLPKFFSFSILNF